MHQSKIALAEKHWGELAARAAVDAARLGSHSILLEATMTIILRHELLAEFAAEVNRLDQGWLTKYDALREVIGLPQGTSHDDAIAAASKIKAALSQTPGQSTQDSVSPSKEKGQAG